METPGECLDVFYTRTQPSVQIKVIEVGVLYLSQKIKCRRAGSLYIKFYSLSSESDPLCFVKQYATAELASGDVINQVNSELNSAGTAMPVHLRHLRRWIAGDSIPDSLKNFHSAKLCL